MTPQILDWLQSTKDRFCPCPRTILEVGSRDVNGSPRSVWSNCEQYVGVDSDPGPGVDIVADAAGLRVDKFGNAFDLVICCETLEHCSDPFAVLDMLKYHARTPGGLLVITTPANGFVEHKYPMDYWRFMPDAYSLFFEDLDILEIKEIPGPTMCGAARMTPNGLARRFSKEMVKIAHDNPGTRLAKRARRWLGRIRRGR